VRESIRHPRRETLRNLAPPAARRHVKDEIVLRKRREEVVLCGLVLEPR
jgi:hypothetical protein